MPAPPPTPGARARDLRLAAALRANLRRRKAPAGEGADAAVDARSASPPVEDGADAGEGLYPPDPGEPAAGGRS